MKDSERTEYLDQFTTLDDAKKEIARLLAVKEKEDNFLHLFCNYSIKESILPIQGYTSVLQQKKDLTDQELLFLGTIAQNAKRIRKSVDVVRELIFIQKKGAKYGQFLQTYQPSKEIDLNIFLSENISLTRNQTESEQRKVEVELVDNLPLVQCNDVILKDIWDDIIWFLADAYNTQIPIHVISTFDEKNVKITLGCSGYHSHRYTYMLDDFRKFENTSTLFEFYPDTLFLYKSWLTLHQYDGDLLFEVQENIAINEPPMIEVTIVLKR